MRPVLRTATARKAPRRPQGGLDVNGTVIGDAGSLLGGLSVIEEVEIVDSFEHGAHNPRRALDREGASASARDLDKDVTLLPGYGSPDHLAVEADVDAPVDRERFHDAQSPGVRGGRPETGSAIAHFNDQPGAERGDAQADRGRAVQDSVG